MQKQQWLPNMAAQRLILHFLLNYMFEVGVKCQNLAITNLDN